MNGRGYYRDSAPAGVSWPPDMDDPEQARMVESMAKHAATYGDGDTEKAREVLQALGIEELL